ncbi:hypothetical protein G9A89_015006 [Geosiphon pyriformis]|nr:hypothetical protein G9A89_015006 [Geosiphon pyriformis]
MTSTTTPDSSSVWNTKLQQFHGGQDWNFLDNFIEDFSVTTNALGTPKAALEAARESIFNCHHYPPANQEPAKTSLAEFLWPNDYLKHVNKLLLGNGASELIDLAIRSAPDGGWKPGPWDVQYKEYQRAAETNGRIILKPDDTRRGKLSCIVNPCNPTGDYKNLSEVKQWIEDNVEDGGVVIVDESMQPWLSREFRSDSLTSQHDYISSLYINKKISLYIIHSWTKLWSCTGLRIGSIVCPTMEHCDAFKRIQVPWSVNTPALGFLNVVVKDKKYMEKTWDVTPVWRESLIVKLKILSSTIGAQLNDEWEFYGKGFLSWVWVNMKNIAIAQKAVTLAKEAGVPVRSGQPGYERPTFVRVAVRDPAKVDILIKAWEKLGIAIFIKGQPCNVSPKETRSPQQLIPQAQLSFIQTRHKSYSTLRENMPEYFVGKVSDVGEGKLKEVTLGEAGDKVLLAKLNGEIFATSHKCTHYGAPLAKGVLSSDGRIICPWHGACFSAFTGDIEDAPALDSLYKFKVTIKGDDIYVGAEEKELKSGKRVPVCSKQVTSTNTNTVIVLGGGASGNAAIEKLREDGFTGRIIVVSREIYLPIDRPQLSKKLDLTAEKIAIRSTEFYKDFSIVFKLGTVASAVNSKSKTVTLENGEKIKFDTLIIATGATPRSIPIPGIGLHKVLYLRTVQDNAQINKEINDGEKKNLVIIGSSFIGMEVASITAKKANVSVIGMEKVPFQRVLGEKIGTVLQKLHEDNGVKFYLNSGVKALEPSTVDPGRVGAVILSDDTKIPADIVLIGAGVAPSTEFLRDSPEFPLERDGGLRVNEHFQVEGLQDIYATGDIASYPYHVTGERIRVEHWAYAENTGRAVGSHIAKKNLSPFRKIPYFWSAQHGKSLRFTGHAKKYDDLIIHGNLEEFSFAGYYALGDQVLAIITMGKDPIASHSAELLRLGKFPSATEIRNAISPIGSVEQYP